MSHNKLTVNSNDVDSAGNISLTVGDVINDTPTAGETLVGTASGVEFGSIYTGISDYLYQVNSVGGSSQSVTSNGYFTQYIDNRQGDVTLVTNSSSAITSTAQGGEGITYGGGNSRLIGQLILDPGTYFVEEYPTPYWSSTGDSELQFQQGNAGSANVQGNFSYCYANSPSRPFYARVVASSSGDRVWPRIVNNTNQRIGGRYFRSQPIVAFKIE